jgi:hypothetical protein
VTKVKAYWLPDLTIVGGDADLPGSRRWLLTCVMPLFLADGFDADVSARARAAMVGVEIPSDLDPSSPKTLEAFEAKIRELKQSGGKTPRAVIMCNPNNPQGEQRDP